MAGDSEDPDLLGRDPKERLAGLQSSISSRSTRHSLPQCTEPSSRFSKYTVATASSLHHLHVAQPLQPPNGCPTLALSRRRGAQRRGNRTRARPRVGVGSSARLGLSVNVSTPAKEKHREHEKSTKDTAQHAQKMETSNRH